MARAIIHAHGGDVTVESEPGQGTTITLSLPRKNGGKKALSIS